MSGPPKPHNGFNPYMPTTQGNRIPGSSSMLPPVINPNSTRPQPIYPTPPGTMRCQSNSERTMNTSNPRSYAPPSQAPPAFPGTPASGSRFMLPRTAYNAINQPGYQNFPHAQNAPVRFNQPLPPLSYPPPLLHHSSSPNHFPSEISQPAKATDNYPKNAIGTMAGAQAPRAHDTFPSDECHDLDDLDGITDLYPSGTINIDDYLAIFSEK